MRKFMVTLRNARGLRLCVIVHSPNWCGVESEALNNLAEEHKKYGPWVVSNCDVYA